jgi:hypothetical protein
MAQGTITKQDVCSLYVTSLSQLKESMNRLSGYPIMVGLSGTLLDILAGTSRGSFGFGVAVKADASTMDLLYARLGSNVFGILRYNLSSDTISKSKEYVWS